MWKRAIRVSSHLPSIKAGYYALQANAYQQLQTSRTSILSYKKTVSPAIINAHKNE